MLKGREYPSFFYVRNSFLTLGRGYTACVPQIFMKKLSSVLIIPVLTILSACTLSNAPATSDSSSSSSQEGASSIRETSNVSYSGTVQTAGISIYMEGTHRLSLSDGKFILLESDSVDLNGYVGEDAKVFGSIRPTVEGGGMIMRVDTITLLESSSSSLSSALSSSSETSETMESTSSFSSLANSSLSASSQISMYDDSFSSVATSKSSALSSEELSSSSSEERVTSGNEERIESMARQDLSSALWTQQYCTSHIGFCIPVHKNWWFRSFGTTSSELWHVEISSEPIDALQDGPIVLRLLTGKNTLADGSVTMQDGKAIFTKLWLTDQHIEIVADDSLQDAVRYIGEHITPFSSEE